MLFLFFILIIYFFYFLILIPFILIFESHQVIIALNQNYNKKSFNIDYKN